MFFNPGCAFQHQRLIIEHYICSAGDTAPTINIAVWQNGVTLFLTVHLLVGWKFHDLLTLAGGCGIVVDFLTSEQEY